MQGEISEGNRFEDFVLGQIWTLRVPFRFLGLQIGTRMTVIKLSNRKLFVHSPVGLNDEIRRQFDELGKVGYVVSPNNLHHLFIGEYFEAYPDARIYASPGLREKRKDLSFDWVLKNDPDPEWIEDLNQILFLGHPTMREVIFFHRHSHTLIVADLIMNFQEDTSPLTKLVVKCFGMYQRPTPPIDLKPSELEKAQVRLSVKKILEWDFDKIVLAHGQSILKDGKRIFKEAFDQILNV